MMTLNFIKSQSLGIALKDWDYLLVSEQQYKRCKDNKNQEMNKNKTILLKP